MVTLIQLVRNACHVCEELRIEFGEGFAEFFEFIGRAVELKAKELREAKGFFDTRTYVFEVF